MPALTGEGVKYINPFAISMPGILALDPSIAMFGWAHAEPGAQPTWGSQRLVPPNADEETIQNALDIFLGARFDVFDPEWIVREQVYQGPNARGNGILACMGWQIDLRAKDRGIGVRQCQSSAFTKHFTGRGIYRTPAAKKRAVVARCHLLGWKVTDNNQADACGILCYAEAKLFPEIRLKMARPPPGGLFA